MTAWLQSIIGRSVLLTGRIRSLLALRRGTGGLADQWLPGRCVVCDRTTYRGEWLCGVSCFVVWCWRQRDPDLMRLMRCGKCGADLDRRAVEWPEYSLIVCGDCNADGGGRVVNRKCGRGGCHATFAVRAESGALWCPRCRFEFAPDFSYVHPEALS